MVRCAAVFVSLVLTTSARSQMSAEMRAYVDQMATASENTSRVVVEKFHPNLTDAEKQIFSQVRIRIDRYDWNLFGTRAIVDQSGRRIVMTIGFILGADLMDRAVLEMIALNNQKLEPYMRYVGDGLRRAAEAVAAGKPVPPINPYCEYLGNSAERCHAIRSNPQYGIQLTAVKISSFAVVLGHEFGHQVKDHFSSAARERSVFDRESEADRYGVTLAIKSGINPMLSVGSFILFGSTQMDIPVTKEETRHPNPLCRVIFAYGAGLDEAEKDAGFQKYLRDTGSLEIFSSSKQQLAALKRRESACVN